MILYRWCSRQRTLKRPDPLLRLRPKENLAIISTFLSWMWDTALTRAVWIEPFKCGGFVFTRDPSVIHRNQLVFKLTVSLSVLRRASRIYSTWSEPRQPIRTRERLFSLSRTCTIIPERGIVFALCPHRQKCWKRQRFLLTLLAGVRFCRHLHVVGGQQAGDAVGITFPPVGVGLVQDVDQLALGEAELILIGSSVVIHGNDLAHWGRDISLTRPKFFSFHFNYARIGIVQPKRNAAVTKFFSQSQLFGSAASDWTFGSARSDHLAEGRGTAWCWRGPGAWR